ncbi:hypothetical protein JTB14_036373 [Gonioctena quinquepunctata]|nr:hypothetical protein JTB14_036373 [Gonioctena quinquepunctata]
MLLENSYLGIGYQAALSLASRGCRIIIADKDDSTASVENIKRETKNYNIVGRILDLASFDSIRRFAKEIIESEPSLHILMNNAGIGSVELKHTEDGLQKTMQVNYFGHFLLTHLLLGLLKKSSPSRIIFTGSLSAFMSKLNLRNLNPPEEERKMSSMYSNSKICQNIAAKCFARKLEGTGVTAYSFHPGIVRSNIFTDTLREHFNPWAMLFISLSWLFGKTVVEQQVMKEEFTEGIGYSDDDFLCSILKEAYPTDLGHFENRTLTDKIKMFIVNQGPCQPDLRFPKDDSNRSFSKFYYSQTNHAGISI